MIQLLIRILEENYIFIFFELITSFNALKNRVDHIDVAEEDSCEKRKNHIIISSTFSLNILQWIIYKDISKLLWEIKFLFLWDLYECLEGL